MQLDGAIGVITGAGSGIGRAIAVNAVARGMRLALVGRREDALYETAKLAGSDACTVLAADITQAFARAQLARQLAQHFSMVHLLINNAGVVHAAPVDGCLDDRVQSMLDTNVVAPITLVRALLPLLRIADRARVVNIGSMFGDIAFPYFAAYSASKFALRGYSDALRRELACEGIGVTYVAPRATRTPAVDAFRGLVEPMGMTLDEPASVAKRTLDAVARDARSAYPRGLERVYMAIQGLFPGAIDANLSKLTSRSREGAKALVDG